MTTLIRLLAMSTTCLLCGCSNMNTPIPVPPIPPIQDVLRPSAEDTRPLCDPNPEKYTPEYMRANAESEECGQERDEGLAVRFRVWVPSQRTWWIISSLGKGHVQRDEGGGYRVEPFTKDGYDYRARGGRKNTYQPTSDPNPPLDVTGNRNLPGVIYGECRRAE